MEFNRSRVVYIRNIPSDVKEIDVMHLGIPFGNVTHVIVAEKKNEAFLEMESEEAASAMVNYFATSVVPLTDRSLHVQHSTIQELKKSHSSCSNILSSHTLLKALQAETLGDSEGKYNRSCDGMHKKLDESLKEIEGASSSCQKIAQSYGGSNTVLRVTVENMVYPVTIDILYEVFKRVGKVQKIVTFEKNNTFRALIQYPNTLIANVAKLRLDGNPIYNGCCTLRIKNSKLTNLNVRQNNDVCRDYTKPPYSGKLVKSMDSRI